MSENFFWGALVISLTIHTGFLWGSYFWKIKANPHENVAQVQVEVGLRRVSVAHRVFDIREYPLKPAARLDLDNSLRLFSPQRAIPISLGKGKSALPMGMRYEAKPDMRRIMQFPRFFIKPIQAEKINNPAYTAYCEMIRNRIKEMIYENYDKIDRGEVYLTFMLDSHGTLVASKINPEKTNASGHLQDISMRSLQQASPFPWFLKGMTLPEYTFNIEIQYQVSE